MADAAAICKELDQKKTLRLPLESVWRDCFLLSFPLRAYGLNGGKEGVQDTRKLFADIMDITTTDSVRTLSSQVMSGLTPPNSRWFQLDTTGRENDEERRWLDDAAQILFENIHASNFDSEAFEGLTDSVCAGWFALYIGEHPDGGFLFEQWPLAQVYYAASKPGGRVDIVLREYTLPAQQALNLYGDKLSEKARKLAEEKPDEPVCFVRKIAPRKDAKGIKAKAMPFESVTVEVKAKHTVEESGYPEFPVVVPRWFRDPSTDYAVGPLSQALPSSMMLQKLNQLNLANADMNIIGMYVAEDDGVLNPRAVTFGPRKMIIANSVDSIKPLQPAGNWQIAQEEITRTQAAIRKILMSDVLQPQDGPAMTATEVHVRMGLVRQLLGPVYGRLQSEYLQPLIERCFAIAFRAGVFTAPPRSLMGKNFSIKYLSPLSRGQKMEEATAIERLMTIQMQVAQFDPRVGAMFDGEEAMRILREAYGVPPSVIRTKQQVDEIVAQKAEEQQQAMMAQAALGAVEKGGGEVVKQAAQQYMPEQAGGMK